MKKHLPAFALAILLTICMTPAMASAADLPDSAGQDAPGGIKDAPVHIYKVPDQGMSLQDDAEYPAKYDPRDEWWFKNNARVENQGSTQLCWAFSATSAAELSWAREQKEAEKTEAVEQLSPVHLGYFFYNMPDDPLGGTEGDSNKLVNADNWVDEGGGHVWTMQHLANQADFTADKEMPFRLDEDGDYSGPMNYDEDLCYGHAHMILENSEIHGSLPIEEGGINTLKAMITKYGAVMGNIYNKSTYMNKGVSFYNPVATSVNHAVTIVGWDDAYSVDNFRAQDGQLPSQPGAWLVMDSAGMELHDNGFFWISYESADLMSHSFLGLDMDRNDAQADVFQYDGSAGDGYEEMEAGEMAANVFYVPRGRLSEKLDRVGFTTFNEGPTDYTIKIYTGIEDPDQPDGGTLAAEQAVHTDVAGYHTFPLETPVSLEAGDCFSVCLCFDQHTEIGAEKSSRLFTAALAPEQSYYFFSKTNSWVDACNEKDQECLRIKAMGIPEICQDHDWKLVKTVVPAKGVEGYDIVECSHCYLRGTTNETPALKPVPNKTKISKLAPAKKAMTVKWKKSTEKIAGKYIDGYQIRYSLKKNMKGAKTVTVKGYKATSKKIKGLKAKKKYYFQVRTYKKSNGVMYRSTWSAAKAGKTR